jgi:hypothetical protein
LTLTQPLLGKVRKQLPNEIGIDQEIDNEDVSMNAKSANLNKKQKQRYCEIYLKQKASPGGYSGFSPKAAHGKLSNGANMRKTDTPTQKNTIQHSLQKKSNFWTVPFRNWRRSV